MADSDVIAVDEPQTDIVSAFAAVRLYDQLAQTAPTNMATAYRQMAAEWRIRAKDRCARLGMKQTAITRNQ